MRSILLSTNKLLQGSLRQARGRNRTEIVVIVVVIVECRDEQSH